MYNERTFEGTFVLYVYNGFTVRKYESTKVRKYFRTTEGILFEDRIRKYFRTFENRYFRKYGSTKVLSYFRTAVRVQYSYRVRVRVQAHGIHSVSCSLIDYEGTKVRVLSYFRTFEGTFVLSKVLPEVRTKVHVGHNSNLWG